jgi:nucleoside-diphosphate-sugar epimerase
MNIFITGATGFLGKRLVKGLVEQGHSLYILARSESKGQAVLGELDEECKQKVYILIGDISSPGLGISAKMFQEIKNQIDAVYHLAAILSFDIEKRDETFKMNVDGTKHTLEFSLAIGAKKFLHVSTAYTLGQKEHGIEELYSTDGPFVNFYEESKCRAEHLVYSYGEKLDVMILRPAIIVGDSLTGGADSAFALYGFIRSLALFKRRISKKPNWQQRTYRLLGNRETTSNWVPVDYVTKALMAGLAYGERYGIYNITNPCPPANKLTLELIKERLDFPNITLVPERFAPFLTEEEVTLNSSISVFSSYINRSIMFNDDNMQKLLAKVNEPPLGMDREMLKRVIFSYNQPAYVSS